MSNKTDYSPPRVWTWEEESGGKFASINRPVAGPTHEQELPVGEHAFQLYSLATPNGVKVTVLFEELLELGHSDAEYDAWPVRIFEGEQFSSGFVGVNPNSKIPAMVDHSGPEPVRVFESGSIVLHLAEKFGEFLPDQGPARTEALNWLFWQMGSAPFLGGGFGHFYAYAPESMKYPIDRYTMEVKRQLDVLDRRLAEARYLAGTEYTVADIANWPWYGALGPPLGFVGHPFGARSPLNEGGVHEYQAVEDRQGSVLLEAQDPGGFAPVARRGPGDAVTGARRDRGTLEPVAR